MSWKKIRKNLYTAEDSCRIYCLKSGDRGLLIDSGSGKSLSGVKDLGISGIDWVLHTHPHRDMSLGDFDLISEGTRFAVPAAAEKLFSEAEAGWKDRNTYYAFDYGDKYAMPLRDIPVHQALKEGDTFDWEGFSLKVMETPGHTDYHMSFLLELEGDRLIFSGDLIHSEGRVWEMDALQGTYEEFIQDEQTIRKVPALISSIDRIRDLSSDLLLPGHGEPISDTDSALQELKKNLVEMMDYLPAEAYLNDYLVTHPDIDALLCCQASYLIRNNEGKHLLIDAGFVDSVMEDHPGILLEWIQNRDGFEGLDLIIPTHYHCDHIAATNAFVRQWGGKVITHEILTDLLQEPERFFLPCLHLNPIKVDQSFKEGESIRWGEYTLHFYHFPGHTWWHQAILLEKPGLKVLFVGDAVDHVTHVRSIDCWNYNPISDDQGAARCVELLRETKPDYLAGGHSGLVKWDPAFLDEMQQFVEGRNSLLKRLIGREHADLGYDTYWLRADPFRNLTAPGATTPVKIKIRNHIPGARVTITPRLPEGWTAEPSLTTLTLPEKEEGICEFNITAPAELASERYLIGLETEMNGQAYGEQSLIIFDVGKWHDPDRRPERIQSVAAYAYGALPQN